MKLVPNKLFFKYFLLFAVNLVFFILILSYMIYFVFVQTFISNQFFKANVATLNEVGKAAEGYLRRTDDVAKYFSITNKELLSFQYNDITIDSSLVNFLDRQKKQILLNDYVFSVYAYYKDKNIIMDLSRTALYAPLTKENTGAAAGEYPRFYDNGWNENLTGDKFNKQGFILLDTRKVVDPDLLNTAVPPVSRVENIDAITVIRGFDNRQTGARGYVIVNLNENFINEYISGINGNNAMQTTFIVNSGGKVVSHGDKSMLGKSLMDQSYIRRILGSKDASGHFNEKVNGKPMEIIFVKSDYVDWYYVSTVPVSYITADLNYLNNVILLIVGLILASAVASVFLMTRRMYSPIEGIFEKIKNISSSTKVQMVKSEVKMIDNLLDSIKQNYDHLGKLVFDNYHLLKYDFLNKLITGEYLPDQLENGFNEYKITFDNENYLVISMIIDNFEDVLKQFKLQDIYLMNQAVINIAEEYLNEKYYAVGAGINRNTIALIVNTGKEINRARLTEALEMIAEMVQKYLKLSVSTGVGNVHHSLDELKMSYAESGAALQNRLNKGNNALVFYDEINYSEDLLKPSAFEEQIIGALKAGQKEKCLLALDNMIEKIKERNLSRQKVENLFTELILIIHKQLNYQDKSFEEICKRSFPEILAYITSVETLDGLKQYMQDTLGILCEYFSSSKKSHNEELITRVMHYVETHYYEDLSLEGVSATLKLTPQYVRKLVKDITGLNLLDYLTDIRIRKAEDMLMKTDLPVQEVAEKVGYNCYRTFLQHFRERSGMIPTQYRKSKNRFSKE